MNELFRKIAHKSAEIMGTSWAFVLSVAVVLIWALMGPYYDYSDTWQLVINTTTTVLTFLMVFLVQNTQNRDAKAIHLKLDELIRAVRSARNQLVDLEGMTDEEMDKLQKEFERIRKQSQQKL